MNKRIFLFYFLIALSAEALNLAPIDFSNIRKWVEHGTVRSPEDLLERLPIGMTGEVILFGQSRSELQESSRERPRILSASRDASLMLTFTGDPKARGGSLVEVIAFDPSDSQFHFKSLDFTQKDPAKIINEKPEHCFACHVNRTPIWDTYPHWVDVYGGLHSADEDPKIAQFLDQLQANQKLRYKYFHADGITHNHIGLSSGHVNEFDKALQRLNFQRVAAQLRRHPDWKLLQPLILDILDAGQGFVDRVLKYREIQPEQFYNDKTGIRMAARESIRLDRHPLIDKLSHIIPQLAQMGIVFSAEDVTQTLKKVSEGQEKYYDSKILRESSGYEVHSLLRKNNGLYALTANGRRDAFEATAIATMQLICDRLGIPGPANWSMSFKEPSYSFTSAGGALHPLRDALIKEIAPPCEKTSVPEIY